MVAASWEAANAARRLTCVRLTLSHVLVTGPDGELLEYVQARREVLAWGVDEVACLVLAGVFVMAGLATLRDVGNAMVPIIAGGLVLAIVAYGLVSLGGRTLGSRIAGFRYYARESMRPLGAGGMIGVVFVNFVSVLIPFSVLGPSVRDAGRNSYYRAYRPASPSTIAAYRQDPAA